MSQTFSLQVDFTSPDQTSRFASNLSEDLRAGDVILLEGGIGAGKTHFARSLIQTRLQKSGVIEDIPSPTFTLVQTYEDAFCELWHADLYRLTHPDEVEELGLLQAFEEAICLIEWPDRLGELTPKNALRMSFETSTDDNCPDLRTITFSGDKPLWHDRILKALAP